MALQETSSLPWRRFRPDTVGITIFLSVVCEREEIGPLLFYFHSVVLAAWLAAILNCFIGAFQTGLLASSFRAHFGNKMDDVSRAWAVARLPAINHEIEPRRLQALWILDRGEFDKSAAETLSVPRTYCVPQVCFSCLGAEDLSPESISASRTKHEYHSEKSANVTITERLSIELRICAQCRPLLSKCATAARDLSLIRLLAAYIVFTALFLLLTGALNGHLVVHGSMDDAVGFRPILTAIPVLQLWLVVFPLALGAVLLVVFLSPPKDALHARLGVRPLSCR